MKREILLFLSLLMFGSVFGQTITTAQPDSACVSTTELYRVANHPGSTYQWTVTNNSGVNTIVGTGHEIHITWCANPGNELVTVRETSDKGCLGDVVQLPVVLVPHPTVIAPADMIVCASQSTINLVATATNFKRVLWTGGAGSFTIANALTTVYNVSPADIAAGSVTLTITAYPFGPCTPPVTDQVLITFDPVPTVAAGSDQTICSTSTVSLNATVAHASTMLWSTSGDGTFVPNNAAASIYTPGAGDIAAGTVTLTMTAQPSGTCAVPASDALVVTIVPAPVADAGTPKTICAQSTVTLNDATAQNYASLLWTSPSGGTFNDPTALHPVYTPCAADLATGSVLLTLTANPNNPCAVPTTDQVLVTIIAQPLANAGSDGNICSSSTFQITTATASNYATLAWTTSGTGTFDNTGIINPTYTPSAADILAGNVTLTLTANANTPCAAAATDFLTLSIQKTPVANAGPGITLCASSPVNITGATAANYSTVTWGSSGTGTWINQNTLTPTYTPSAADTVAGSVTLTLTANALAPCAAPATSQMIITFSPDPVAMAGVDQTICSNGSATMAGKAFHAQSVLWTTAGDGTFNDATLLNAIYTPGANDIAVGFADLTLTATGIAPCGTTDSDVVHVVIIKAVVADAGPDIKTCPEIQPVSLAAASVTNGASLLWTTSGTGTFTNPTSLGAFYTPSQADINNGSVTLTLTVQGNSPCALVVDTMLLEFWAKPVTSPIEHY